MQTDMHYYGTYAMARASGLNPAASLQIAIAAEYVDDSDEVGIELKDGTVVAAPPTAHHPLNRSNLDIVDQRNTWLPFHFMPGNEGQTMHERLICRRDSTLAQEMVAHHVELPWQDFSVFLIGITAHVYADTFSHYGFSGIASPLNHVDGSTINLEVADPQVRDYIKNKAADFWEKYVLSAPANLAALGHGAVATFPDRPYLTWSFTYESSNKPSGQRRNRETFLEACQKLHTMFVRFGDKNPNIVIARDRTAFDAIRGAIQEVLAVEGDMGARIDAWQRAARAGGIYAGNAPIPTYTATFANEMKIMSGHSMQTIKSTDGYAFLQAATFHRDYVLEELLPKYGLQVLADT